MLTPNTVQIWLSEQAIPLSIILILLVGGFVLLKLPVINRRKAMQRDRAGFTEDSFVQHLSTFGFDPLIARTTYRYLQSEQNIHFPILVKDTLDEDLGLGIGDVEEALAAILAKTNRRLMPGLRHEPFVTVEDLVRFVQASPRKSQIAA